MTDRPDFLELVVRPSENPRRPQAGVAHFFSDQTTNRFRLVRHGNRVTASVTGADERRNDTGGLVSRVFNYLRLAGAWAGAKKPQWRAFTRNLVEVPEALRRTGVDTALSA